MIYGKHSKRLLFFDIFYIFPSNESAVRILIERERASSVELQISNKSACVIRVLQISNESAGVFRCTTNIKQARARLLLYCKYQTRARASSAVLQISNKCARVFCCTENIKRERAPSASAALRILKGAHVVHCAVNIERCTCARCAANIERWRLCVIDRERLWLMSLGLQICGGCSSNMFFIYCLLLLKSCNYQTTYIKSKFLWHMYKSIQVLN